MGKKFLKVRKYFKFFNSTIKKAKNSINDIYKIFFSQTENVGCGTGTSFVNYQKEDGCVGPPQPWNEIKLADVQDMQYFGKDGKGEVCFRGDNVMQGKVEQLIFSITTC